jgi:hypothetical protein
VARHAAEATARGEPATPEPQPGTGAPPSEPADGGTPPQTGPPEPPERPEDSDGPYSRQKAPRGQQRANEARLGDIPIGKLGSRIASPKKGYSPMARPGIPSR